MPNPQSQLTPRLKAGACNCRTAIRRGRYVRRTDKRPTANVHGSVVVCMGNEPTRPTEESILTRTICTFGMPANRTGLRCVVGIDSDQRDTRQFRLVFQERAQLSKRPAMQIVPLGSPNRYPLTNSAKFFDGDSATGAFRFTDNQLAYLMVHVFCKTFFSTRQQTQPPCGATGLLGLKSTALAATAFAHTQDGSACKCSAVRCGCDVDDTEVNPKPTARIEGVIFDNVTDLVQVVFAVTVDQIALALQRLQQLALLIAAYESHALATVHCPDGNLRLWERPGQNAIVVGHRTHTAKGALDFLVQLVGVGYDGDHANGSLRGKSKPLAHFIVCRLLQIVGPKGFCHPRVTADVVGGFIPSQQRAAKCVRLFLGRLKFDLHNQFHTRSISLVKHIAKPSVLTQSVNLLSLPMPEGSGIPELLVNQNSPRYEIQIEKEPRKYIERLPRNLARRVAAAIDGLATNPYPANSIKLAGYDYVYRLRIGDLRILYTIYEQRLLIVVVEIKPRGDAYRNI